MHDEYITARMTDLLDQIKDINDISYKIHNYPKEYIKTQISQKQVIGVRSFYWLISAHNSSAKNLEESNGKFAEDVIDYYVENYQYTKQRNKDNFWFNSAMLLFNEICEFAERNDLIQNLPKDFIKDYEKGKSVLIDFLKKNSKSDDFAKIYSCFWAYKTLKKSNTDLAFFYKNVTKKSIQYLDKNISQYSYNSPKANQLEMAIFSNFAIDASLSNEADTILNNEARDKIIKVSEICFDGNRNFFEKRFVQSLETFEIFHSMPFEDIFIFLNIQPNYLSDTSKIIEKIIDFIKRRTIPTVGLVHGIFEESSPDSPKVAPYFTGYSIFLLNKLLSFLKLKLKKHLFSNIHKLNSEFTEQPPKKFCLGNSNMYDTEEKTLEFIELNIAQSHKKNNSLLLFGPPGTGKTTIVGAITNYLSNKTNEKWDMITFAPSIFLTSDSYSSILKNVATLFDIILVLEDCVFFFDEAEELIRDRNIDDLRFGRMFTASMLLFLNRIKNSNSHFIFATNYIDKMDQAGIRKGRFSMRKGIGWVNNENIEKFVSNEFNNCSLSTQEVLKEKLKFKTIIELYNIKDKLFTQFKRKKYSVTEINSFFDKSWKKYISDLQVRTHIDNCIQYDDSYVKND